MCSAQAQEEHSVPFMARSRPAQVAGRRRLLAARRVRALAPLRQILSRGHGGSRSPGPTSMRQSGQPWPTSRPAGYRSNGAAFALPVRGPGRRRIRACRPGHGSARPPAGDLHPPPVRPVLQVDETIAAEAEHIQLPPHQVGSVPACSSTCSPRRSRSSLWTAAWTACPAGRASREPCSPAIR